MSLFIFHHDSRALPEPLIVRRTRGEVWVILGGRRELLGPGPRRNRLDESASRRLGRGPQWIFAPCVWRCYMAMGSISSDDPLDILFFSFALNNLVYEGAAASIDIDHVERLTYCATALEAIVDALKESVPAIFFLYRGNRVLPERCDVEGLSREGRPASLLDRISNFQLAALDNAAFVAWWTLSFKGWEMVLEEWQVEMVRSCAFRTREKAGCFLNLSTDYPLSNFEFWIDHGVPIYYLWSEALYHDKRFSRANPDVLREYWELRQTIEDDDEFHAEVRMHFLRTNRAGVLQYDNFFQDQATRSLLLDTEPRTFQVGTTYVLEAFQNYRPVNLRDRAMIERFLVHYETVLLPDSSPQKVGILRWAPRAPFRGQPDEEGYTVDYGAWEYDEETRFPGRAFDKETGWFTNDILVLRELFKVAFAPERGEAFMPDGTRLQDPLLRANRFDFVAAYEERVIREAEGDGKERPPDLREYYEFERADWLEKQRVQREEADATIALLGGRVTGGSDLVDNGALDDRSECAPVDTPPGIHEMPELLKRMIFPNWRTMQAGPSEGREARRERGSFSRRDASRGASSSASSRPIGTASRRSASPSRGPTRLADPTRLSAQVLRPNDPEFEDAVTDLINQLELLFTVTAETPKRRGDDRRAPRVGWDHEVIERAYIHFPEPLDALRVLLYTLFIREIFTPERLLNYIVEHGIKFRIFIPRDPIPAPSRGLNQTRPSGIRAPRLQGLTGETLFQTWEDAMSGPFWAKTHFPGFIQEGGTIAFLARYYATEKVRREAGLGVSTETRIFARNSDFLPDSHETFQVVHDDIGSEERGFALGTLPPIEANGNPRHMLPPTHSFEHKYWDLGTGEWTDWEEDYLIDVLHRWKLGKEVPRTAEGWAAHMRVYRKNLARNRSLNGRDKRSPGSTEAAQWCRMLQDVYGFSIKTRKISTLADMPEPVSVRRFQ